MCLEGLARLCGNGSMAVLLPFHGLNGLLWWCERGVPANLPTARPLLTFTHPDSIRQIRHQSHAEPPSSHKSQHLSPLVSPSLPLLPPLTPFRRNRDADAVLLG